MDWSVVSAFLSVLAIDLTLAMDNALVVGAVASKLPSAMRRKAILIGVGGAFFFRILFASVAMKLFAVVGLTFAGGLLLLWVAWKLWRDLRQTKDAESKVKIQAPQALRQAALQILLADISMSLDNTLAVTGAARSHFWILVFGLLASVILMGMASHLLAKISQRYHWISYIGLAIVIYVAVTMIVEGAGQVLSLS